MNQEELPIDAERPARAKPLPPEFPGIHYMDEQETEAAIRILKSRSLFRYYGIDLQKEVEAFEAEFADFVGTRYALAVGSGTSALSTALAALAVGPGQQVIVPAYLWVSVVAAIVNQGAIPVLADIDDTFCLDPASVEKRITSKTTGIVMVHMSGAPGNAAAIRKIATERGLFLLEDCSQCGGGSIEGKKVGAFGDVGIFSFQMNKNMTSGEGGCVVTDNLRLYRRAVACHDVGFPRDEEGRLQFDDRDMCLWGRGCRLDELRAALLRVQLRKLPLITCAMRRSKHRIREALAEFPWVRLRRILDPAGDTGSFLITTYPDAATARRVNLALRAEGIVASEPGISNIVMTEWGMHLYFNIPSLVFRTSVDAAGFPWNLAENEGLVSEYSKGVCPAADNLFETSILLPIPSCLSEKDENDVIRAFQEVLRADSQNLIPSDRTGY